jgi:hypothetical protein
MRSLLLFLLLPVLVFGQVVEPKIHPGQIGQFGATTGQGLIWNGTEYVPSNLGDITGTGSVDAIPKFSSSKNLVNSILTNTSQQLKLTYNDNLFSRGLIIQNTNSGSFAINGLSFINAVGSGVGNVDYFAPNYANSSIADYLVTNTLGSTTGIIFNTNIAGSANAASGNIIFKTGGNTAPAIFVKGSDGSGNLGVNTSNPLSTFHVNGLARVDASGSTATTITGRDVSNNITNVTLGANLSMSSGVLSVTPATNTFVQGGNSFAAAAILGTNDANTMRIKANSYGITINNTGYIQLDDTPTGPPSTPPAGSIFYSSNSQALFFQEDAGAANTVKILTDKPVNALLLLTSNTTPGGENYNIRCDANAGAFTITLGASLVEGKPYLVRCTRNSTNAITFSAASGYTLGIDTDTALNPTTLVSGAGGSGIAAPAKIYLIQRIGTVINIK